MLKKKEDIYHTLQVQYQTCDHIPREFKFQTNLSDILQHWGIFFENVSLLKNKKEI